MTEGDVTKGDGVESEQKPSAKPPVVSSEGEKKESDTTDKGEKEDEEEEEVFEYDYDQMKSIPEMVNVDTSDMLTLLYPFKCLIRVQSTKCRAFSMALHYVPYSA